jgi:succinyl-CoA synthetase beta subunit
MRVQNLLAQKDHFTEAEVKDMLKEYTIPVPEYQVVKDINEIELRVHFPLAVKVCSPYIVHKTDVGGVKIDIKNREELTETLQRFQKMFPDDALLLEEMQKKGVEFIAGLINDAVFGMSIMVGMGGIFAELCKDVSFRLVPLKRRDAEEMLSDLEARDIFSNFRGMALDKKALIDVLLKLSRFGEKYIDYVNQMDLNPIFLYEQGLMVVDAKLIKGE